MKPFNWREIIEKLQDKGDPQLLWDYITALRGPDNMNYYLKTLFTVIVRGTEDGYCGLGIEEVRATLLNSSDKEIIKEIGDIDKLKDRDIGHWFNHLRYGVKALYELGLVEYEFVEILRSMWLVNWRDGLKKLLNYYRKKLLKEEK